MSSVDFTSFLKLMVHKKASDLFITAGIPPSIKVHGRIAPITQNALSPQQSRDCCGVSASLVIGPMRPAILIEGARPAVMNKSDAFLCTISLR